MFFKAFQFSAVLWELKDRLKKKNENKDLEEDQLKPYIEYYKHKNSDASALSCYN